MALPPTYTVGLIKVKTSELCGIALDWAVAYCNGRVVEFDSDFGLIEVSPDRACHVSVSYDTWATCGPIIEKHQIGLLFEDDCKRWRATHHLSDNYFDINPLVAAMRCYVGIHLGAEVTLNFEMD